MFPLPFAVLVFLYGVAANSSLKPCEYVGQYIVDPENCHNFYQCSNSGWVQKFCPSNLVFNEEINVCDWPKADTVCGNSNYKDDENQSDNSLEPCEEVGQNKTDTKHCDLFYRCTSCGWSLIQCEDGQLFNPDSLECDEAENVECASDDPPHGPCTEISELKPDPKDCGKFYQCTSYGWQSMPCPATLYFNPNTSACDYTYNVECKNQ